MTKYKIKDSGQSMVKPYFFDIVFKGGTKVINLTVYTKELPDPKIRQVLEKALKAILNKKSLTIKAFSKIAALAYTKLSKVRVNTKISGDQIVFRSKTKPKPKTKSKIKK